VRRFGAMFAAAKLTVPHVTVVLRKGCGLGAMAMADGGARRAGTGADRLRDERHRRPGPGADGARARGPAAGRQVGRQRLNAPGFARRHRGGGSRPQPFSG
jgi:hypothetical protein